ncbi:MAG TPA: deoxyribose-phosphate aldolase [Candidatus Limiplasma stercoravium]|nr:deoxyribose-phosphate aldolase [Candidatus Limiplasma stercoravium]
MHISRYLDLAILKPDLTPQQAREAIALGIRCNARTVCVRPCDISMAAALCDGTQTEVSCVLDFPHGCGDSRGKAELAQRYACLGAREIDMVMNYGLARGGEWALVEEDIRGVAEAAHRHGVLVKVILETCELTDAQIRRATEASVAAGADFVKTSTGFASGGATPEAVRAMLEAAAGRILVKASGGIRDYQTARMYVDMGAQRLGVGYAAAEAICAGQDEA